ncbi:HalOD1 output domain-containing protein [Haloterrigena alkaliphila]|uniref:Halobacterial output domain-containing protein n=1 Tax=Haloterrigena alkaliphila TaxID=2816475 RepID=A0A8A2VE42_9EURY|nr:HalOD1 output domain-containing protein [Haloterrigena alkaliphila]QSW98980.1 hypothetical protein J0X25_16595 [Haloterrigena alkaliphila]
MSERGTPIKRADSSGEHTVLYTTELASANETTPVCAVVSAVATVEGTDPVELPPLYDAIDPDSLNQLFASGSECVNRISFDYAGYSIVVEATGTVQVRSV